MYSKSAATLIKKEFWTAFGMYMKPVLNAAGESINWLNYKTGIRHLYFRMDAGKKIATIAIEIKHTVAADRIICFEKLLALKSLFKNTVKEDWQWQPEVFDEDGTAMSRIFIELGGVNIFNKEDWPAIISFFKQRLLKLDEFWQMVKPQFE